MGRPVQAIVVTDDELEILQRLIAAQHTPQQLAIRARIIVALHQGVALTHHARNTGQSVNTVLLWRNRWRATQEVGLGVLERLSDEPRSGCPARIQAEQWCQVMALACEPPQDSGRPISHWSGRELTDEILKRGVIDRVSVRHVQAFLKGRGLASTQEPVLAQPRA